MYMHVLGAEAYAPVAHSVAALVLAGILVAGQLALQVELHIAAAQHSTAGRQTVGERRPKQVQDMQVSRRVGLEGQGLEAGAWKVPALQLGKGLRSVAATERWPVQLAAAPGGECAAQRLCPGTCTKPSPRLLLHPAELAPPAYCPPWPPPHCRRHSHAVISLLYEMNPLPPPHTAQRHQAGRQAGRRSSGTQVQAAQHAAPGRTTPIGSPQENHHR